MGGRTEKRGKRRKEATTEAGRGGWKGGVRTPEARLLWREARRFCALVLALVPDSPALFCR